MGPMSTRGSSQPKYAQGDPKYIAERSRYTWINIQEHTGKNLEEQHSFS